MWQEITDREQAWELMLAGLLFWGSTCYKYPYDKEWMEDKDIWDDKWGTLHWDKSYIRLEE